VKSRGIQQTIVGKTKRGRREQRHKEVKQKDSHNTAERKEKRHGNGRPEK
jgi:hypothetical protein